MKNFLFYVVEGLLTVVCKIFAIVIRASGWVINTLAKLFKLAVVLVIFVATWHWIGTLPTSWQSLAIQSLILGGAFSFVCIVALRIWKPEKFFRIFN